MRSAGRNPASMSPSRPEQSCEKRYKGVRRRRWGKWVSEIRVPGTRERLWLGSYSTPEAAAAAHDTAVFFLRGPRCCSGGLNFPEMAAGWEWADLPPSSVQTAASNTGMAVDARLVVRPPEPPRPSGVAGASSWEEGDEIGELCRGLELIEDMELELELDISSQND